MRWREERPPLEEEHFRPFLYHYDGPKFRLELSVKEVYFPIFEYNLAHELLDFCHSIHFLDPYRPTGMKSVLPDTKSLGYYPTFCHPISVITGVWNSRLLQGTAVLLGHCCLKGMFIKCNEHEGSVDCKWLLHKSETGFILSSRIILLL